MMKEQNIIKEPSDQNDIIIINLIIGCQILEPRTVSIKRAGKSPTGVEWMV